MHAYDHSGKKLWSKSFGVLLDYIEPAIEGGTVDETATKNAALQHERILTESTIVRESGAEVVTAFFHIETGTVEFH